MLLGFGHLTPSQLVDKSKQMQDWACNLCVEEGMLPLRPHLSDSGLTLLSITAREMQRGHVLNISRHNPKAIAAAVIVIVIVAAVAVVMVVIMLATV